jgi:hypothetical protein
MSRLIERSFVVERSIMLAYLDVLSYQVSMSTPLLTNARERGHHYLVTFASQRCTSGSLPARIQFPILDLSSPFQLLC